MGTAFSAESTAHWPEWVRRQMVLFALNVPDMVCHLPRRDCSINEPHLMSICRLFPPAGEKD